MILDLLVKAAIRNKYVLLQWSRILYCFQIRKISTHLNCNFCSHQKRKNISENHVFLITFHLINIEECPDSRMTLSKKALKKYELLTASNFVRAYSFCRWNFAETLTRPHIARTLSAKLVHCIWLKKHKTIDFYNISLVSFYFSHSLLKHDFPRSIGFPRLMKNAHLIEM